MVEVIEKYYREFFHKDCKKVLKDLNLVEAYLNRYQYQVVDGYLDEEDNVLVLNLVIDSEDGRYTSVYGKIEMTKDKMYVEIDKELFNGELCIYEYLDIFNNSFNGNICDFGFYNANVVLVENNQRQENFGEVYATSFDKNGIKDDNTCLPYASKNYDGIMNEIMEIHELQKEEIAEKFNFDNYIVQSLIVHGEDDYDAGNYIDFDKTFDNSKYRRRRR